MFSTRLRVGAESRDQRPGSTSAGAAHKLGFRADIQGLRAIAVLLVLLSHYFEQPAGGFIGVDVFFVISGFLITGLLLREHENTGRISIRGFYARRARRILPVGVFVIAVTSAVSYLLLIGGRAQQVLTDALWATGFAANIHFQRIGTDYFQNERPPSPLQHYWSLAVEEQFYVLWPLVLLLMLGLAARRGWRRPRATLAGVTAAALAGSLYWSLELTASNPTVAYFSTVTRAWELGVGALLALAHRPLRMLPEAMAAALSWAGLAGLVASAFVIDASTPFPGAAAIAPVLATAALLVGGMGRISVRSPSASWGLGNAVNGFIGQISYSLYLWHWPVLILAEALIRGPSLPVKLLLLAGSVGLATLSFSLIERPVLRSSWLLPSNALDARARSDKRSATRARSRQRQAVGLLVLVVVTLALAVLTLLHPISPPEGSSVAGSRGAAPAASQAPPGGPTSQRSASILAAVQAKDWPTNLVPALDELDEANPPEDGAPYFCNAAGPKAPGLCRFGEPTASRLALVLGDSTAITWLPGLRGALEPKGWGIQGYPKPSCTMLDAPTLRQGKKISTDCAEHREWVYQQAARLKPAMIIVTNTEAGLARLPSQAQGAAAEAEWRAGMTSSYRKLAAATPRLVVLAPAPLGGNPQECVTRFGGPDDCEVTIGDDWHIASRAEQAAAAAVGAEYIDSRSWFCTERGWRCPAFVGSTTVRRDTVHLTPEYSAGLAPELATALFPATPG